VLDRARAALDASWQTRGQALWPVAQTAIAAAAAWELARLAGHSRPLFAPVIAIVAMGIRPGRRGVQAVVLVLGATLGIVVADVFIRLVGTGAVQVAVIVFLAMSVALLVSGQPVFVTQAGISALLVVAVEQEAQGWAPDRLVDALIGAGVALVFALVLFPLDPVAEVRKAARPVLDDLVAALGSAALALRTGDLAPAVDARLRARRMDERRLLEVLDIALGAARRAPRRRHAVGQLAAYAAVAPSLDVLLRGVRTTTGAAERVVRGRSAPAPELGAVVDALTRATAVLRDWLEGNLAATPRTVRAAALDAVRARAAVRPTAELGAATILHLTEALAVELLRASGLDGADAQRALREALAAAG
jgi:uncharacterized membrane protein YccC